MSALSAGKLANPALAETEAPESVAPAGADDAVMVNVPLNDVTREPFWSSSACTVDPSELVIGSPLTALAGSLPGTKRTRQFVLTVVTSRE